MKGHTRTQMVVAALLVALAPWYLGCATEVHLRRAQSAGAAPDTGQLVVRAFENRSDRKRDVATRQTVVTALYRREGKRETLVREERSARWSADKLAAGTYVLDVRWAASKKDAPEDPPTARRKVLVIRANETTVADVVLHDPRKLWIGVAIGGATLVALAVAVALAGGVVGNFTLGTL